MSNNKSQVKFYRGKEWKNPEQENGEILFINKAFDSSLSKGTTEYESAAKFGSIYQDDKIVGTTEADKLCTTSNITIAGGPLANEVKNEWPTKDGWLDENNKPIIPSGASLQEILTTLFLKEIYPSTTSTPATYSLSVGKPTSSLSVSGTVEVGTAVSLKQVKISSGTSASSTAPKVTGFTYGYKNTSDGDVTDSSDITGSVATSLNTTSNYSLNISINSGFVGTPDSNGSTTTITNSTASATAGTDGKGWESLSISEQSLGYVKEGTNKLTITSTGATYTFTPTEVGEKFIVSNIGNTDANKKSTATDSSSVSQPAAPTNTLELSVTGARYMFWGAYETKPATMDSTEIRKHTGGDCAATSTATKTISLQDKTYFFIALPSGRTLNNLYGNLGPELGSAMSSVTSSTVSVSGANGYTQASYTLYEWNSDSKLNGNYTIVIK